MEVYLNNSTCMYTGIAILPLGTCIVLNVYQYRRFLNKIVVVSLTGGICMCNGQSCVQIVTPMQQGAGWE